ncbi:MAG: excinuclease ABC subunit UvrC [Gammaproteobacteria bacterium]|jgi:excinuclease ABC subunit C
MSDESTFERLRDSCRDLPTNPGIYRFSDAGGQVIYVGKAKHLKRRVSSYFNRQANVSPKVRSMVGHIVDIAVTVTRTENEAFLLESNLIKDLKPRYNIVLRDDKSYPYIYVEPDEEFPKLNFHRGARNGNGRYFGPYPNAGAVRSTLNLLQKLFMLRQCDDSYFRNRARPCLQHQIKRCTAPCVGLIDSAEYREDVQRAILFLEGRSAEVVDSLALQMDEAAAKLEFERAARFRDQIQKLQRVQSEQYVASGTGNFDIIVCRTRGNVGCVQVFFVRSGRHLGNKAFFPAHTQGNTSADILSAFLPQFYLAGQSDRDVPPDIILSEAIEDADWLTDILSDRRGSAVRLRQDVRGERAKWLEMAVTNADIALEVRISSNTDQQRRVAALQDFLDLDEAPGRIECFDVSHTGGEATVASCVVFDQDGARKSDYRRFNIRDVVAGDDYAAMEQALQRRYTRVKREDGNLPELLLIDGGKGQVGRALSVLAELQIDDVAVVGVAKGTTRKAGLETLIMYDGIEERVLPRDSAALLLIQQIRDEAHRFAITAHRQSRAKNRTRSPLDQISGVGAKRRQQLIRHFGGWQGVARAGVDDLCRVPGISRTLAQKIYDEMQGSQ